MNLIIGGAHQGKLSYANKRLKTKEDDWCDGRYCKREAVFSAPYILHLESYIKRELEDVDFITSFADNLIRRNPNAVILTNEIGMGLVPTDEKERFYREITGRICTKLCTYATRVDRVSYGIGMVIKNDKNAFH